MRKLTVPIVIVTAMLLVAGCTGRHLALNEFRYNNPRAPGHDPNFTMEQVLNRFSSHVASGTVTGAKTDAVDRDLTYYSFAVDSVIVGELEDDEIILLDFYGSLEVGQEYLLFLSIRERTRWRFTKYYFNSYFVLLIDEDQQLWRLEDPVQGTVVPPFVDEAYNDFSTLSSYIRRVRNQGFYTVYQRLFNPPFHFIESVDSLEELYELSDLVMDIHIISVHRHSEQTASVRYNRPRNVYKGTPPEEKRLALPGDTATGRYLVFLTRSRGTLQLSTRHGSLIPIDSPDYDDVLQWLEQQSQR